MLTSEIKLPVLFIILHTDGFGPGCSSGLEDHGRKWKINPLNQEIFHGLRFNEADA